MKEKPRPDDAGFTEFPGPFMREVFPLIGDAEWRLLCYLRSRAPNIEVSMRRIVAETMRSESTVRRAMKGLLDAGLLILVRESIGGWARGENSVNAYRLPNYKSPSIRARIRESLEATTAEERGVKSDTPSQGERGVKSDGSGVSKLTERGVTDDTQRRTLKKNKGKKNNTTSDDAITDDHEAPRPLEGGGGGEGEESSREKDQNAYKAKLSLLKRAGVATAEALARDRRLTVEDVENAVAENTRRGDARAPGRIVTALRALLSQRETITRDGPLPSALDLRLRKVRALTSRTDEAAPPPATPTPQPSPKPPPASSPKPPTPRPTPARPPYTGPLDPPERSPVVGGAA